MNEVKKMLKELQDFEQENQDANQFYQTSLDAISLYKKDIYNIPLLTAEEEKMYALRMKEGDSFAKKKLIESNLRLVLSVARKYAKRGFDFNDLVQEGNMGLIKATENFDVEKGYKFATYATWCIRYYIETSIKKQMHRVTIPDWALNMIYKIKEGEEELTTRLGHKPSSEELIAFLGIKEEHFRLLYPYTKKEYSLEDSFLEEDENITLGDMIVDEKAGIDQSVEQKDLQDQIKAALERLPDNYATVIKEHFFPADGKAKSFPVIGRSMGCSGENVRKMQKKALLRLSIDRSLRSYIKD